MWEYGKIHSVTIGKKRKKIVIVVVVAFVCMNSLHLYECERERARAWKRETCLVWQWIVWSNSYHMHHLHKRCARENTQWIWSRELTWWFCRFCIAPVPVPFASFLSPAHIHTYSLATFHIVVLFVRWAPEWTEEKKNRIVFCTIPGFVAWDVRSLILCMFILQHFESGKWQTSRNILLRRFFFLFFDFIRHSLVFICVSVFSAHLFSLQILISFFTVIFFSSSRFLCEQKWLAFVSDFCSFCYFIQYKLMAYWWWRKSSGWREGIVDRVRLIRFLFVDAVKMHFFSLWADGRWWLWALILFVFILDRLIGKWHPGHHTNKINYFYIDFHVLMKHP